MKKWYKQWRTWAYVFAVLAIFGLIIPDQSEDSTNEPAEAQPAAKESLTQTKSEAELAAEKANEERAAKRETKIAAVQPASSEPSKAQTEEKSEPTKPAPKPTLAYDVNEYLGDRRIHGQSVKDGYYTIETDFGDFIGPEFCEEESVDLAEIISEHPDYAATGAKGVKVVYISGVTDVYGNSADETVMYIEYSNETMARINFDNFDTDNVITVADDYYRMAAFK